MNWWQYTLLSLTVLVLLVLSVRAVRGIFEIIHWICRRYGKMIPAPNIPSDLINLRIRMERTNFWFHLVRNNPRHREQYYFALIAMVGYENWKNVNDTIRMNWESARLNFDRMYGMVKDFAENADMYAGLFRAASEKQEPAAPELPADHPKQLNEIHKDLAKKIEGISSDLDKKLENLTKLLPPQDKIKEVRDALNEWIPPDSKADKG